MHKISMIAVLLVVPGLCARIARKTRNDVCGSIGCGAPYNPSRPCQCNDLCGRYGNCCSDYGDVCEGGSVPTPPNATQYWRDVDMKSMSAIQARLRQGSKVVSYSPGLWNFYKESWVNLPGVCQEGGVYDVYSTKCWTPGSGQCGNFQGEGDCYNREHSWVKSWWGSERNSAYSDIFHVFPSDGKVNNVRDTNPWGKVNSPTYVSHEGHKFGLCSTPGISGICFEPTDRVKGLLARSNLYVAVRYMTEFSCCSKRGVVDGAELKPVYRDLLLKWHSEHPPADWEVEFNNRAHSRQGNRNPFIDYPQMAQQLFR